MERRPAQTGCLYGGEGGMLGMLKVECWVLSCGGSCRPANMGVGCQVTPPPVEQSGQVHYIHYSTELGELEEELLMHLNGSLVISVRA